MSHVSHIDAIERIQWRFTKQLRGFGDYNYSEQLHLLKLTSLKLRCLHIDLIWCYKIIFGHFNLSPSDIFQLRISSITRGHPYKILKQHSSCNAPTIRMDCQPIQTNWCPHLYHPHRFYAGCPSWLNPPNLSWLGTGTKYAGFHAWWLGYNCQYTRGETAIHDMQHKLALS